MPKALEDGDDPVCAPMDISATAMHLYPGKDFFESTVCTKQIAMVINAIQAHTTPKEQPIGFFKRSKLK